MHSSGTGGNEEAELFNLHCKSNSKCVFKHILQEHSDNH